MTSLVKFYVMQIPTVLSDVIEFVMLSNAVLWCSYVLFIMSCDSNVVYIWFNTFWKIFKLPKLSVINIYLIKQRDIIFEKWENDRIGHLTEIRGLTSTLEIEVVGY